MNVVDKAEWFARGAHRAVGQTRKVSRLPYEVHLEDVVNILKISGIYSSSIHQYETYKIVLATAWLHDTVEDTGVTIPDIMSLFGLSIARHVHEMTDTTKREFPKANRAERKKIRREQMQTQSTIFKFVKMADMIANLSDIEKQPIDYARMYLEEKKEDLVCFCDLREGGLYQALVDTINEKERVLK